MKRYSDRFPVDFMFEISKTKLENWRRQFGISNQDKMVYGIYPRKLPLTSNWIKIGYKLDVPNKMESASRPF